MTVGCTPRSSSSRLFFSRAPHMTVTEVVPSPATTSCRAGCARQKVGRECFDFAVGAVGSARKES